ncbi:MAG: hypothetical protein KGL39_56385 [Patescibacteria group bacterium]|nr:hypothetical protein [Patescibacteria group bacterium]
MTKLLVDSFVNPNAERIQVEQARGALAWNIHRLYFHDDHLSEKEKRSAIAAVIKTAQTKFGETVVAEALGQLNDRLRQIARGL